MCCTSHRDALHAVVMPCCFPPSSDFKNKPAEPQTLTHTHTDVPAWEARLAWQAGSVHQSGRPFMRLHESAGNNNKRLIIGDQADLLPNPTP